MIRLNVETETAATRRRLDFDQGSRLVLCSNFGVFQIDNRDAVPVISYGAIRRLVPKRHDSYVAV
jgi:hypothetical protein